MPLPRVRIGKLQVDVVTFDGALEEIEKLVKAGCGGSVFTPNVDHVMMAERNEPLRDAYSRASLSLADGVPVVWASRVIGPPLPTKVSGSDLIAPLMRLAGDRGWRVYLLGGADGVVEATAKKVAASYGVNVVGMDNPIIGLTLSTEESAAVERIAKTSPDLLLVALGCPKQELFIDRARAALPATVAMGVGASFDFIVGRVSRSPAWMSRVGLEWLYRLAQEPRRLWRRYLVQDTQFLFVVVRTLLSHRSVKL